jgi:5-(carboxyamino)imidazole ribonucleotide synthase
LVPLRPGPKALEIGQDRIFEKTFFGAFATTAPWRAIHGLADLTAALAALGTPAILKTCRLGYDGKGQVKIDHPEQAAEALAALGLAEWPTPEEMNAPAILEGFIAFEREVSVIVARAENGATAAYPVVENVHRHHILDTTTAPATINESLADEARRIAITAVERLDLIGLLAVELFVTKDAVLVNEMAPRPHNSGHWTMDAGLTDQFEQLVRAVCGLPLGDCRLHYPVVMKNLLGNDIDQWHSFLADPNARLHLYGKAEARAGRKMGHVNFIKSKG